MVALSQMSGDWKHLDPRGFGRQSSSSYRSRGTKTKEENKTVRIHSPRTSAINYNNLIRWLWADLLAKCNGKFACFKKALIQINNRIDNLNRVLNQSDISQRDKKRYEGIKDRLNFRLLVISRFIDLFPEATDITLFGWGMDNKVTPNKMRAPSELSGVQCKINGKKVYLNFNSTIGNFEELSKKLDWQTSFETKNAQWYFCSKNEYFISALAMRKKPIKLPSQRETVEARILYGSLKKPTTQPSSLRCELPSKYKQEITVELEGGPIVSAYLDFAPPR